MTKIKDLVTVSLDSMLVLFPIDSERYELAIAVGQHWKHRNNGLTDALPSGDKFLNDTVLALEDTFIRNADALASVLYEPNAYADDKDAQGRARRTRASIEDEVFFEICDRTATRDSFAMQLCTELFSVLYERLLVLHATGRCP